MINSFSGKLLFILIVQRYYEIEFLKVGCDKLFNFIYIDFIEYVSQYTQMITMFQTSFIVHN